MDYKEINCGKTHPTVLFAPVRDGVVLLLSYYLVQLLLLYVNI